LDHESGGSAALKETISALGGFAGVTLPPVCHKLI